MQQDIGARRRRFIIDFAKRHQKPGTGSQPGIRRGFKPVYWPDLRPLLSGIRWAVIGGVATRQYMPERMTRDLDIAIMAGDASAVAERFRRAGYVATGKLTVGGLTWRDSDGNEIDVLEFDEPWAGQALDQAQTNPDVQGLPILPLPYLVLLKASSGRGGDIDDVLQMLGYAKDDDVALIRAAITTYRPELAEDFESMIELARLEFPAPPPDRD